MRDVATLTGYEFIFKTKNYVRTSRYGNIRVGDEVSEDNSKNVRKLIHATVYEPLGKPIASIFIVCSWHKDCCSIE